MTLNYFFLKPAEAGLFVFGVLEIHLHTDLVFLINELKTILRFFLYFSFCCGLK